MESGKIIVVANQKGGVAKTSTVRNLSYALAEMGKKVLVVDFDPQYNLTTSFGVLPTQAPYNTGTLITNLLLDESLPDTNEFIQKIGSVDLIPSSRSLTVAEANLLMTPDSNDYLAALLNPLRLSYDYIIVDTNPSLGSLTINALTAADEVIIPIDPELFALTGLQALVDTIQKIKRKLNPSIEIGGILFTKCNKRTNLYRRTYGGDFLAVDPLTAKILAKVAVQAATDSESRKRILFMILAPVLGLLLLIAFILYLITSPFSVLSQWLIGDEVNVVEDFQKQYGYNQQLGIYEKDYIDGSGQSYEGIIFTDGVTEVVYYNQLDERWADLPYGTDNIGGYGCGPTSMAIVVSSLTDQTVDPPTMAEWAYQNGYWCSGNGSYHSLIPGAAEGFGLQWESISTDDPQAVVDTLASGKLIVALMSKGHFTSSGHFMVLRGVTSEGKILVADPASKKRSEQEWDISIILDEARKGAAAGGPLWAIY